MLESYCLSFVFASNIQGCGQKNIDWDNVLG